MSPMPTPPPLREDPLRIDICKDAGEVARHAAALFTAAAGRALGAGRRFSAALSGGRTPRRLYELLSEDNHAHQVVWPAVELFWSDERCVGPDHADSNYGAAREALLSKVPVAPAHVHRIRGEDPDPRRAAADYERELRSAFLGEPRLDLVLLGMGEDGHTASLFPGSPLLEERVALAAAAADPAGTPRVTLTLPAINAARLVAVLVTGPGKAAMARRVLGARARDERLPIQRVRPAAGQLVWILDADAASELEAGAAAQDGPGPPRPS
ncbi:MAG TPA: 6-phosphogluconolactonase [Candidatus Polarisedimenticolia bacterium]|nr:6-phosphogluconolactonase [Candidatus Polarisedimenticolia bacterium]